jgi:large subunit ribosomal protein L30
MSDGNASCFLVVRLRGPSGLSSVIENTLGMLNLKRSCWATLVPNQPSIVGMLRKVEKCVTWGEPDEQLLLQLISKRGEKRQDVNPDEVLKELGSTSVEDLVKKVLNGEAEIKALWRFISPTSGFIHQEADSGRALRDRSRRAENTDTGGRASPS